MLFIIGILFICLAILIIFASGDEDYFGFLFFGLLVLSVGIVVFIDAGLEKGYKDGQVDSLTGTIRYEKITHDDQTVTWELIEEDD